jgi:hypothetical protein
MHFFVTNVVATMNCGRNIIIQNEVFLKTEMGVDINEVSCTLTNLKKIPVLQGGPSLR